MTVGTVSSGDGGGQPGDGGQPGGDGARRSRRRRRWRVVTAVAVVALAAGGAAAAVATRSASGIDDKKAFHRSAPAATAQVTRRTLVDVESVGGTLGYGPEVGLPNQLVGTVTSLAEVGATVKRGEALYRVDDAPVVLLYGSLPAYRTLAEGTKGADVAQFERELRELGYTGFTVDEEFSATTGAAVRKWQKKLKVPQTGAVERGRVVFAPAEVRVAARKAELGGAAQPGQAVLTYTGVSRVVSLKLTIGKARLARRDAPVSVTLPDGRHTPGTVTRVATVVDQDQKGGQDSTRIEVMISVADQAALAGYDEAAVQVGFSAEERQDVLTVPVAALLALAEGGYGLQVVENGSTRILPVQTGLFSGGQVEVRGEGLSAGTTVGMPK